MRFFKNAPLAGSGTGSHKRRASQPSGGAFSGGTKSLHETPQIVQLRLYAPKKVFEGSKGRFFKNAPWQGVGQGPTKGEGKPAQQGAPFQAGRSPFTKRPQTVRLCLYTPKKFLRVPRGVFSKTHPWQGVGQGPTKRERASHRGAPFQAGRSPFTKRPRLSSFAFTNLKKFLRVPRGVFSKTHPWQGVEFCKKRTAGGREPTVLGY